MRKGSSPVRLSSLNDQIWRAAVFWRVGGPTEPGPGSGFRIGRLGARTTITAFSSLKGRWRGRLPDRRQHRGQAGQRMVDVSPPRSCAVSPLAAHGATHRLRRRSSRATVQHRCPGPRRTTCRRGPRPWPGPAAPHRAPAPRRGWWHRPGRSSGPPRFAAPWCPARRRPARRHPDAPRLPSQQSRREVRRSVHLVPALQGLGSAEKYCGWIRWELMKSRS